MPRHPARPGFLIRAFELPEAHIAHLDAQACYEGCTRAAYLRRLIARDIDRQGVAAVRIQPSDRA